MFIPIGQVNNWLLDEAENAKRDFVKYPQVDPASFFGLKCNDKSFVSKK